MTQKVGRPLQYGESPLSTSERLGLYRTRSEQAGLTRFETYISDESKALLKEIAAAEKVTMSVAGAALLEGAIAARAASLSQAPLEGSSRPMSPAEAAPAFFAPQFRTVAENALIANKAASLPSLHAQGLDARFQAKGLLPPSQSAIGHAALGMGPTLPALFRSSAALSSESTGASAPSNEAGYAGLHAFFEQRKILRKNASQTQAQPLKGDNHDQE